MQGNSAPIPSSEKAILYLVAAKDHLGLVITFILTLLIPLGGIIIGIAGNEILYIPIVVGTLFLSSLTSCSQYFDRLSVMNITSRW